MVRSHVDAGVPPRADRKTRRTRRSDCINAALAWSTTGCRPTGDGWQAKHAEVLVKTMCIGPDVGPAGTKGSRKRNRRSRSGLDQVRRKNGVVHSDAGLKFKIHRLLFEGRKVLWPRFITIRQQLVFLCRGHDFVVERIAKSHSFSPTDLEKEIHFVIHATWRDRALRRNQNVGRISSVRLKVDVDGYRWAVGLLCWYRAGRRMLAGSSRKWTPTKSVAKCRARHRGEVLS